MIQRGFYVAEQDVTGYRVEANRVYTPKFTRDRMQLYSQCRLAAARVRLRLFQENIT